MAQLPVGIACWGEKEAREWLLLQHLPSLEDEELAFCITGVDLLTIGEEDLTSMLPSLKRHEATRLWSTLKQLRKTDEQMNLLLSVQLFKREAKDLESEIQETLDDDDDAALAARLQLEEASLLQDVIHNGFAALKYDIAALQSFETERSDWEAAQEFSTAFEALRIQEEADSVLAHRLGGRQPPPRMAIASSSTSSAASSTDDAGPSTSGHLNLITSSSSVEQIEPRVELDVAVGDSTVNRPTLKGKEPASDSALNSGQRQCAACLERKPRMYFLASTCQHSYCHECLRELFKSASKDETLLPVRCCKQPIDQTLADDLLTGELAREFKQRLLELQTVNKMYCPRPTCSAFINLDNFAGASRFDCALCGAALCAACRTPWHEGFTCDDFQTLPVGARRPEDLATILMAEELGWKQCTSCQSIVSISSGCNHMICRCGYAFCYRCGTAWKNCTCPQWDEDLLRDEASRQVNQQEQRTGRLFGRAEGMRQLVRAMDTIRRQNHDCTHQWNRDNNMKDHNCTNCGYELTWYGFRCEAEGGCARILCRTCRFHRFR